jgi:hypothetical protein
MNGFADAKAHDPPQAIIMMQHVFNGLEAAEIPEVAVVAGDEPA